MALIAATDFLQMTELNEFCLSEIQTILTPSNVLPLWKEAGTLKLSEVIQHCEEVMASRIAVISTQADFLALNHDQIGLYVRICDGSTQADDVLEAVMRWVSNDADERQSYLQEILFNMDVHECTTECIKMVMRKYASIMNEQSMTHIFLELNGNVLSDSMTGRNAPILTSDACVIGGANFNNDEINPVVWAIRKSCQIEKLCDISYEGFTRKHSVCKTPEGFVITGGLSSSRCMMYISAKQLWKTMPDLPENRCGHGSICVKQCVYVFGGNIPSYGRTSKSVYMMSLNNATWQPGPDLPFDVKFPKVADIGNIVYLLNDETTHLVQLDEESRRWKKRASLPWKEPNNYYGVSMTSAKGHLYVAGGYYKDFAYYKPCIDTWCFAKPPLQRHRYGSLLYHKDKLILLGGNFKGGSDVVEEYSFEEKTWSLCSYKMPPYLYEHCGLVLNVPKTDSEHA